VISLVCQDMIGTVTLIGFGEAGATFASAGGWEAGAFAYDTADKSTAYDEIGVIGCATLQDAVREATIILSVVTADAALSVAKSAAEHLSFDTLFCDMNSVAPETKQAAAAAVEAAGGRYVDVAVMSPVNPSRLATPLLVSGPHAEAGLAALVALGFDNIRVVGDDVGRASTIKMLRSVMYKGVEALTAECLLACERAGVTDEVLGSFGNDWSNGADYRLDRMMVHGLRRAAEMAEVVKTLEGLGVEPLMTRGTLERQAEIGAMDLEPVEGLRAKLTALQCRHCEERSDEAIQMGTGGARFLSSARNDEVGK
jgi:3-hydroxyisobutyrate dehydrogenase-like beta-hydroxyacid dehydrogenase